MANSKLLKPSIKGEAIRVLNEQGAQLLSEIYVWDKSYDMKVARVIEEFHVSEDDAKYLLARCEILLLADSKNPPSVTMEPVVYTKPRKHGKPIILTDAGIDKDAFPAEVGSPQEIAVKESVVSSIKLQRSQS